MFKITSTIILLLSVFLPYQLIAMDVPQLKGGKAEPRRNHPNKQLKMAAFQTLIKLVMSEKNERVKLINIYPLYMADDELFQVLTSLVDQVGIEAIELALFDFIHEKFPNGLLSECAIKALDELLDAINASGGLRKSIDNAVVHNKNNSVKIQKPFSRKRALNPIPALEMSDEQFIQGLTSRDALRFARVTPLELREFLQGERTKNLGKLLEYGRSTIAWIAYQLLNKTIPDADDQQSLMTAKKWANIGLGFIEIKNFWGAFQVAQALALVEADQKLMDKRKGKPKKYKPLFYLLMEGDVQNINANCTDPSSAEPCLPIIGALLDDIITWFAENENNFSLLNVIYRNFRNSIIKCQYENNTDEDVAKFISDFSIIRWDYSVINEIHAVQELRSLNNDFSFEETPLDQWNCAQLMSFLRKSQCDDLIPKFLAQKIWSGRSLLMIIVMHKDILRSKESLTALMRKGFNEQESRTILHRFFNGVNSPNVSRTRRTANIILK